MQCPNCKCQLKRGVEKHSNTEIDYCRQCKGIWLDKNELLNVCKFSAYQVSLPDNAAPSERLCPECEIEMYEFEYPETKVQIDMCPVCSGFWLDSGEIKEIELVRTHWATSSGRKSRATRFKKQKPVSNARKTEAKQPDYSLPDDRKYKTLDIIAKSIVIVVVLAITASFFHWFVFAWKRKADSAKRQLQKYYTNMPKYEDNRVYIQQIINTNHQQVYRDYKYIEETTGHNTSYFYDFRKKSYLARMKEEIARQAKEDNNNDVLTWTNKYEP